MTVIGQFGKRVLSWVYSASAAPAIVGRLPRLSLWPPQTMSRAGFHAMTSAAARAPNVTSEPGVM
ncbi:hypothetical protein AB0C77_12465 [Streptomyces sp. NPDC048629]|uniref:hypothetical protein n=1 Tax=Streptomyces sp. NPDC048629 TaxID=3154824 RepID=UPI003427A801